MKIYFLGTRAKLFKEALESCGHKVILVDKHEQIKKCDVCLVSGYYRIIPKKYLNIPKYGFIGFHETNLPEGRGCAPLNWTLINNKTTMVVSMFKITERMDEGDVLIKYAYLIKDSDTYDNLREEANRRILEIVNVLFNFSRCDFDNYFRNAAKQEGDPTYYRKRIPSDSMLDINKSIKEQWNLIRACSDKEGYPAFFEINNKRFNVVEESIFDIINRSPKLLKEIKKAREDLKHGNFVDYKNVFEDKK